MSEQANISISPRAAAKPGKRDRPGFHPPPRTGRRSERCGSGKGRPWCVLGVRPGNHSGTATNCHKFMAPSPPLAGSVPRTESLKAVRVMTMGNPPARPGAGAV